MQLIYINIVYIYTYTNIDIASEMFQIAFVAKSNSVLGSCSPNAHNTDI